LALCIKDKRNFWIMITYFVHFGHNSMEICFNSLG
jgi:hypothetical protein